MEKYVESARVVEFQGEAGSAVFVDTDRVFHCGSRCSKPRLAFIVNYTSGFNYSARNISQLWHPDKTEAIPLSRLKRFVLGQYL